MFRREKGFYERYIKRLLDILLSLLALVLFSPLFLLLAVLVRLKMGSPVLFRQPRPGLFGEDGRERIFDLYKFRTMTEERDAQGRLLPDAQRLPPFGVWLRRLSLDELPELFNILKGDMSLIGPRPQLVRDMVFMSERQRMRHTAKPGLSGLAQVRGRNAISWEDKLDWDLEYIEHVSFWTDLRLVLETVRVVLTEQESVTDGENATALDYGDALLREHAVSREDYEARQAYAKKLLREHEERA